jgi:hypothetical protein
VEDVLMRFVTDLLGRLSGPLTLRLFLQPAMGTLFAIRDGLKDARQDRTPYFWGLFTLPMSERRRLIREGWRAVMKVFIMAIVLDVVYQVIVFRWFYPFETLAVAIILAILPYLTLRGVVDRLARPWMHPHGTTAR